LSTGTVRANEAYSQEYYLDRQASPTFHAELRHLCALLRPLPGERILEVGCGGGALLASCIQRGAVALGLDINPQALALGRRGLPQTVVIAASGLQCPFGDGSFDAVVSQHVLEHFDDADALLKEWHRVLRPGGRVVAATPNRHYPDPDLYGDPDHSHIYSRADLREALRRNGFVVERCYTLVPYLGHRRLTFKAARWFLFLRHVPVIAGRGLTLLARARKPAAQQPW